MSEEDIRAFEAVMGRHPRVPEFKDLTGCEMALVDDSPIVSKIPDAENGPIIRAGLEFPTLLSLQMWLQEYSVKHNRPYKVEHSNRTVRYTVVCETVGCPWTVRARRSAGGSWKITSVDQPHTCGDDEGTGKYLQLTTKFIAYRLMSTIKAQPSISPRALIEIVKEIFDYEVSYGKAWRAREIARLMIYGDWSESYEQLPVLMKAMKDRNPSMVYYIEHRREKLPKAESTDCHGSCMCSLFGSIT